MTRLDVSRGLKSNTQGGAVMGVHAGALGAVVYCKAVDALEYAPMLAMFFGAAGGLVGGIIGHNIKTDLWEKVPLERLRVSQTPQRDGGFALGFSVRF